MVLIIASLSRRSIIISLSDEFMLVWVGSYTTLPLAVLCHFKIHTVHTVNISFDAVISSMKFRFQYVWEQIVHTHKIASQSAMLVRNNY